MKIFYSSFAVRHFWPVDTRCKLQCITISTRLALYPIRIYWEYVFIGFSIPGAMCERQNTMLACIVCYLYGKATLYHGLCRCVGYVMWLLFSLFYARTGVLSFMKDRDGTVVVVTAAGWTSRESWFNSQHEKEMSCNPKCSGRLRDPPSGLFGGYWG